jgi:hypothetical protein
MFPLDVIEAEADQERSLQRLFLFTSLAAVLPDCLLQLGSEGAHRPVGHVFIARQHPLELSQPFAPLG